MSEAIVIPNEPKKPREKTSADAPTTQSNDVQQTDLMNVAGGVLSNINYKIAFLLFAVSLFLFSDVFIDFAIRPIGGTVESECTTTKGTLIQLIFMVIAYIVIDLAVKYEFL